MERLHLIVFGDVHGVNFRYYTYKLANNLGLSGWVRNNSDGSVELVAEGNKENLEVLLGWSQKGPDYAKVERVEKEWQKATGEFSRFEIRY
jgi:acylphosphatase